MPWEGTAFWSHGTSQSRGVAVLVRAGLVTDTPRVEFSDTEGRLLRVGLKLQDSTVCSFLVVYAPTEPPNRAAFFAGPCTTACLLGPWTSVRVDPSVWCVAGSPLLQYTVRGAAVSMVQWRCRTAPGWLPGGGVRPKLWGLVGASSGEAVVADMAGRQKRRWEEAIAAPGPSVRQRAWLASDLAPVYHASWFDPSPPRAHVLQRVAGREPVVTQQ